MVGGVAEVLVAMREALLEAALIDVVEAGLAVDMVGVDQDRAA